MEGRFGPDERDPFERRAWRASSSRSRSRAPTSSVPTRCAGGTSSTAPSTSRGSSRGRRSRPAVDRALRFRDGLGDVLDEQALVRWHLEALVRLTEDGELGEPERDLFPALRHPEGGVLWLGGATTTNGASPPRWRPTALRGPPRRRSRGGPALEPGAHRRRRVPRCLVATSACRLGAHHVPRHQGRAGAPGRLGARLGRLRPGLGCRPGRLVGPADGRARPARAPRGRSTAPRAVCPTDDRHGSRARSLEAGDGPAAAPFEVIEERVWRSALLPIHLQLLEAYRRVTEGAPGAVRCRECGHPILALDPRRTAFCNDRERFRFSQRERRKRLAMPPAKRGTPP